MPVPVPVPVPMPVPVPVPRVAGMGRHVLSRRRCEAEEAR